MNSVEKNNINTDNAARLLGDLTSYPNHPWDKYLVAQDIINAIFEEVDERIKNSVGKNIVGTTDMNFKV